MPKSYSNLEADDDFEKAYLQQKISAMLTMVSSQPKTLLSFEEVKAMLKPSGQRYLGVVTVPLDLIVGSEERYADFNSAFLPRNKAVKGRWISVDKAYQNDITLPPVALYQLGGLYFVRDGHHRISVAKTRGVAFIDAEVTELTSAIKLDIHTSMIEIKAQLLQYERQQLFEKSNLDQIINMDQIYFSEENSYQLLLLEIISHRHEMEQHQGCPVTFEQAAIDWYQNCYLPIALLIDEEKITKLFPKRTTADLYLWVAKSWQKIKQRYSTVEPSTVIKHLKKSYLFNKKGRASS